MAKDDLNFNLDEFLASHSQGTKHMHSPKKKRASQSSTRTAAQKSAAKKQKESTVKESSASDSAEIIREDVNTAVSDEPITPIEIQPEPEYTAQPEAEHPSQDSITGAGRDTLEGTSDIFIPAALQEETPAYDAEMIEASESQQQIDEETTDIQPESFEAEITVEPEPIVSQEPDQKTEAFPEVEQVISEAEQIEEKSEPIDPEYFFRKDVKFDMPYLEPRIETAPSEPLPKYKDRTSEISFARKRLSDTASVGVRRLKEHEKSNAKIYSKPAVEESKPTEEEILQERLRRDRELTEKILRKAYEQEALNAEFGADPQVSDQSKDATESQFLNLQKKKKASKSKKNKKKQISDEEERTLPVVQVGTSDEDSSQSIIDVLENALDEDVIELEYVSKSNDETHSYDTAPEKKKNKAQTLYFFIGLFFTVMSVIGIVVTAKSLIKFASNVSDDSKQKQEFAEYIYPVVVTDPAAFGSVNDLSDEAIIKAALWDIIIYDDASKYTHDASNNMYVPYIQVENHAKSLFGTTNIVHATVVFSQELTFFYDSESRMYKVPISPQLFPNTPVVREIDKVGERYTLTVDYQEPTPNWELMNSDYTPGIKKTMEYILTKYNDGYTIISINNVE